MTGKDGKPKKHVSLEAARLRLADLCSRSEQCSTEILGKLTRMGIQHTDAAGMLEWLQREGFVDDRRYACALANDKLRFANWGPLKIKMALLQKGISSEFISEALDGLNPGEVAQTAAKVAAAKSLRMDLGRTDDRRKLLRYLYSRGFDADTCRRAVAAVFAGKS